MRDEEMRALSDRLADIQAKTPVYLARLAAMRQEREEREREEREREAEVGVMVSAFEAVMGLALIANPSPRQRAHMQRIWATLAWLRASCEADGLPDEITALVLATAQGELLAGTFPLVGGDVMG